MVLKHRRLLFLSLATLSSVFLAEAMSHSVKAVFFWSFLVLSLLLFLISLGKRRAFLFFLTALLATGAFFLFLSGLLPQSRRPIPKNRTGDRAIRYRACIYGCTKR